MNFQEQFFQKKLRDRTERGTLRSLRDYSHLVDFASNDYLGFAEFSGSYSHAGATGSRLISGNSHYAESTERFIASYHDAEAALIYNSGYMANVGLFGCIADRNDVFLYDEFCHASIIDGMRLSYAKAVKFRHNDMDDLKKKFETLAGNKIVIAESVYSMDGDLAPLDTLCGLCEEFDAALYIDEAHAVGIFGKGGKGLVHARGLSRRVTGRIFTYGKAMGLHGAAIAGGKVLINYLVNFSRSFIYTTAPAPYFYDDLLRSYTRLKDGSVDLLLEKNIYFTKRIKEVWKGKMISGDSCIHALLPGSVEATSGLAASLAEQGLFVKAILSPTVKEGSERLRICIHSFNTYEEIDRLLNGIDLFSEKR